MFFNDGPPKATTCWVVKPALSPLCRIIRNQVNTAIPDLTGFHDIYRHHAHTIYDLEQVNDRLGQTAVSFDHSKLIGIVESTELDDANELKPREPYTADIAQHVLAFLKSEVAGGRLPPNLTPIQSGIGSIADSVLFGLLQSDLKDLEVWTGNTCIPFICMPFDQRLAESEALIFQQTPQR